ncbi:MAG: hypothetical protein SGILL_007636 [Bacillariaceae sp.]
MSSSSPSSPSPPSSSPLLELVATKRDVFDKLPIREFCADSPHTFYRLGQTCKAFHDIFGPHNNKDTWKWLWDTMLADAKKKMEKELQIPPARSMNNNNRNDAAIAREINLATSMDHRFFFQNDERMDAFQKVMAGNVLERMKSEMASSSDSNILMPELAKLSPDSQKGNPNKWRSFTVRLGVGAGVTTRIRVIANEDGSSASLFELLWLQPATEYVMNDINCYREVCIAFRKDVVRMVSSLLEANMIDIITKSHKLCLQAHRYHYDTDQNFPFLDEAHLNMYLAAIGAKAYNNPFGGRTTQFPTYCDDIVEGLPQNTLHCIVRRLAFRAGVIMLTHNCFEALSSMINKMMGCLLESMFDTYYCHIAVKYCGEDKKLWAPTPNDVTVAAETIGLKITRFLDEANYGDTYKQELKENFKLSWQSWSRQEQQLYLENLDQNSLESDDDMDLDSDWESLSDEELEEDDLSCSSLSLVESDDDYSIYSDTEGNDTVEMVE